MCLEAFGVGVRVIGCQNSFLFLVSVLFVVASVESKELQKNSPVRVIWATVGKDIELPCDVTPPLPSESVSMVFWFKDTSAMPIYSLDARGDPLEKASHLAAANGVGSRSYFITDHPSTSRLKIQNVTFDDQGVFRCRVDFLNSPTRNFRANLTLVELPTFPKIFNDVGEEIKSEAGPFLEGDELFLACQVQGGRPRPNLAWWHNGTILDNVVDTPSGAYTTVNNLQIRRASRSLKGAKLECRASSIDVAGVIVRKVLVIVYLRPNKVKIVSPNELMASGKTHTVKCETSGSYPPAKLTWLLNRKPINSAVLTEEENESFTSSILSLTVEPEDDGKELVCRAYNPRFPGGSAEDSRQIHVAYPPKVAVQVDSRTISPVKEGDTVQLQCDTIAKPKAHSYSWYHDGHIVPHKETAGIFPVDDTLTLKNIKKSAGGEYSCSATNSEGETYSPPFHLTVQYAPSCKRGFEEMRVGASPNEELTVQCHVDAFPEVTRFSWTYNTTKGVLPVQGAKMQNDRGVSTLHFVPGTADIESLSCWAANNVGRQELPCQFYVVPANSPESPRNCVLKNATTGGLELVCTAGEDGGLQQNFVLEVSEIIAPHVPRGATTLSDQAEHSAPLFRVLGELPVFRLHSLKPGRSYQFVVYAENAKGRSNPPVVLPNVRVEVPIDILEESGVITTSSDVGDAVPIKQNLTLILLALTAVAVLLIVGIVTVATALACRKQPRVVLRRRRSSKPPDDLELSEAGFGDGFHRRSAQYRASLYAQETELDRCGRSTGPDLILAPANFPSQSSEY